MFFSNPGDFQTLDKFAKERDVVNLSTGMADFEPISDTEKVLNSKKNKQ